MDGTGDAPPRPDTKPGSYYVTVIRGCRVACLVGPFVDDHAGALAMVEPARALATGLDPFTVFDRFGTTRFPAGTDRPGALNDQLMGTSS